MKITILTLFPNMFDGFLSESIIKRACEKKQVEFEIIKVSKATKTIITWEEIN
jgi:tRNA (guanine37-N1)-methyltransferase